MPLRNTFLSSTLKRWYDLTAPPMPPDDAPLAQRVIGRRQQATSSTLLSFLFVEILHGAMASFILGKLTILSFMVSVLCLILAAYCNRRGYALLAGILPVLVVYIVVLMNSLTLSQSMDTINLPALDIFIIATLVALPLLPPWSIFLVALINIGCISGLLWLLPKTSELQAQLVNAPIVYLSPIFLQLVVALIAYRRACDTIKVLKEADRADEIQKLYEEIHQLYEEQKQAAVTDAITGLPNHRAIMQHFQETLSREKKTALLFVDIDHFKHINDTYGHLAGDAALCEVGKRLQEVVSSFGRVGRYGGEEFAIVLPHNDILQASQVAELLRLRIAETPCVWQSAEQETPVAIPMSASIGIAIAPLHGSSSTCLLEAADAAMYRSKQNGRNCVSIADIVEPVATMSEQVVQEPYQGEAALPATMDVSLLVR